MNKEVYLMWDEAVLTIAPSDARIEKFLTYKEKSLEPDPKQPWKRVSKTRTLDLFKVIQNNGQYKVIQTMQGLWLRTKNFLEENGYKVIFHDLRMAFPRPKLGLMTGFRFKQQELVTAFLAPDCSGLLGAPTRYGKCFGLDTMVLMADGKPKAIQLIKDGDYVMGPDSLPRKVIGSTSGFSELFEIIPNYNGMRWVCNKDHVLHVQRTRESNKDARCSAGKLENITVEEWQSATKWFRHVRKIRRVALEFPEREQYVDPYIYGVWLGDGHSDGISFTNAEPEIWKEIRAWAETAGLVESDNVQNNGKAFTRHWVKNKKKDKHTAKYDNPVRSWLRNIPKTEGIRDEYLRASREQRLQLLAGLLDTDGESNADTNCGIVTKHEKLANDIVFLCNSLGLAAVAKQCSKKSQTGRIGTYWRVGIRGDSTIIPFRVPRKVRVRKNKFNCLNVGFDIKPIGAGTYYGFTIDNPDGLFLLSDCTVVHNSTCIKNVLRAYPEVNTVVTVPGVDLVKQLHDDIKESLPHRTVKLLTGNKAPCDDINVVSMDSLYKCDTQACRMLLVDEPHACVTATRLPELAKFDKARKYGFGATLKGRFDQRDILIEALLGPVLAERTFKEAVEEGAVCPLIVFMLVVPLPTVQLNDRDQAYKHALFKSERIAKLVKFICHDLLPKDWQTLIFIKNEAQAEFFLDWVGEEGTIAMAKRLTKKERETLMVDMCSDNIKRCIASEIYAQGVTFNHVRALINLSGGGANTSTIQKPGRLAEIRPGKKCGVVFDFFFNIGAASGAGAFSLRQESLARARAYEEKGYKIIYLDSFNELKDKFAKEAL